MLTAEQEVLEESSKSSKVSGQNQSRVTSFSKSPNASMVLTVSIHQRINQSKTCMCVLEIVVESVVWFTPRFDRSMLNLNKSTP